MVRKTLAAIAFSALTMGSAQALTIDDFSVTQLLSDPGTSTSTVTGAATSIIGTERSATIVRDAGADPATLAFNSGGTGTMSIANGTGGLSTSIVTWDGVGIAGLGDPGLGGIDLTVGGTQDAFDLRIVANDFAAQVVLSVFDTAGNLSDLEQFSPGGIPGPSSTPFLFEFADFVPGIGTGTDFTSIASISLTVITTLNATDIEMDFLGTTTTQVSEPETLLILGLGLAGLGFARRRFR